jgi:POT family proton-dependent oligopeptide transporter
MADPHRDRTPAIEPGAGGPTTVQQSRADRRFFGHPLSLATPAATEVFERFSFYGMRSILALYLLAPESAGGMGLAPATALSLTAVYSASAYLASIGGGWLADRSLGARRAVLLGGLIIMCGHILLALPVRDLFYAGLVLVVTGTGLLKPNVASMVGDVYPAGDPRRDSGFSIFYMAINLGAFVAPLVCGWLGQRVSYQAGFATAAVGMALGLTYFLVTRRNIAHLGTRPAGRTSGAVPVRGLVAGAAALLTPAGITLLLSGSLTDGIVNAIGALTFTAPVVWITAMYRSPRCAPEERRRLLAYIPLFVGSTLFWMMFEQSSTALSALADSRVAHSVFGLSFPTPWLLSVNPVAVIALAPVAAWLWTRLPEGGPGTPTKMGGGVVLMGAGFLLIPLALALTPHGTALSPMWLIVVYVVQTIGELMLSPVGISATTRFAPAAFAGQTMGVWYLSMAAGAGLGAQVVKVYTHVSPTGYFLTLAAVGVACGALLVLLNGRIRGLTGGVR